MFSAKAVEVFSHNNNISRRHHIFGGQFVSRRHRGIAGQLLQHLQKLNWRLICAGRSVAAPEVDICPLQARWQLPLVGVRAWPLAVISPGGASQRAVVRLRRSVSHVVGPGQSAQSRPKVGPKSVQSRPKVGPKLAPSRPRVGPELAQSRPRVGPGHL